MKLYRLPSLLPSSPFWLYFSISFALARGYSRLAMLLYTVCPRPRLFTVVFWSFLFLLLSFLALNPNVMTFRFSLSLSDVAFKLSLTMLLYIVCPRSRLFTILFWNFLFLLLSFLALNPNVMIFRFSLLLPDVAFKLPLPISGLVLLHRFVYSRCLTLSVASLHLFTMTDSLHRFVYSRWLTLLLISRLVWDSPLSLLRHIFTTFRRFPL